VNERFYFVDLPGYGYAKVPKAVKDNWGKMIESYLVDRTQLKLAVLLVDGRRPPEESDVTMKRWLDHQKIPTAVILTKADKVTRSQLHRALQTSAQKLNTKEITAFSAVTALGKNEILKRVEAAID
jgi:GTP-binding protein